MKNNTLKNGVSDTNKIEALDHNKRGDALYNLGEWKKAIEEYSKAIELNPKLAVAYFNRHCALNEIGEYYEAYDDKDMANSIEPYVYEDSNGYCYERKYD